MNRSKSDCKDIRYQCNRKECRGRGKRNVVSIKTGTWFGKSHITLKKSFFLTYCFVHQMSYADTIRKTSIELVGNGPDDMKQIKTSSESVCHEICINIVMDESDNQIGGAGFTVEIDEVNLEKGNIIMVE